MPKYSCPACASRQTRAYKTSAGTTMRKCTDCTYFGPRRNFEDTTVARFVDL